MPFSSPLFRFCGDSVARWCALNSANRRGRDNHSVSYILHIFQRCVGGRWRAAALVSWRGLTWRHDAARRRRAQRGVTPRMAGRFLYERPSPSARALAARANPERRALLRAAWRPFDRAAIGSSSSRSPSRAGAAYLRRDILLARPSTGQRRRMAYATRRYGIPLYTRATPQHTAWLYNPAGLDGDSRQ